MPHAPDSWWEIEIHGDAHALSFVRTVLVGSDIELVSQGGRHLLRNPELDALADVDRVRSQARSHLESLSGAAKLFLGWDSPLQLGHVVRRHPDGRTDYFLEVDSVRMEVRVSPVTLRVTRRDGTVEERGPGRQVMPWLSLARESEAAGRALRLVAQPDLGWVELYRIMEIIQEDAGASVYDWTSKRSLERFKRTANSVQVVGDEARHGSNRHEPPKRPMSLAEGRKLITDLARTWLDQVSKDAVQT